MTNYKGEDFYTLCKSRAMLANKLITKIGFKIK